MRRRFGVTGAAGLTALAFATGCSTGSSHPAVPASMTPRPAGTAGSRPAGSLPANYGSIYVTNAGSDTVTVIAPDESTTTIPVGDDPRGIAIAPAGTPNAGTVYVADNGSPADHGDGTGDRVTAIDPGGRTRSIKVGVGPFRLVVAPAGGPNAGWVYLSYANAHDDSGSVITEIKPDDSTVDLPATPGAHELAVAPPGTPNAGTVYLSNNGDVTADVDGTLTVLDPDGSRHSVPTGPGPLFVSVAPAGAPNAGTAYVANDGPSFHGTTATAVAPDRTTSTLAAGPSPALVAVAPAGVSNAGTLFIPNGADGSGNTVTRISPDGRPLTIAVGTGAAWAVVAPAGPSNAGTAYVLCESFDSSGNALVGSVTLVEPDGSTSSITAGVLPFDAVVAPTGQTNGGSVYVTNFGAPGDAKGTVTVITPGGRHHTIRTGGRPNGIAVAGVS